MMLTNQSDDGGFIEDFTMRAGLIAIISVMLVGAASASAASQSAFVSPGKYREYSCDQLLKAGRVASLRATALAGGKNAVAANSKLASTESTVVLPAALDSSEQVAGELSVLKEQMQAIEDAAIQSQCDIQFVPSSR
jgi:hypothetical protein